LSSTAWRSRTALAAVDDGSALRGRTLVQELAYGTLRHWGRCGSADPGAGDQARHRRGHSLRWIAVALYQLDHTDAPPFAVVDRAVDAAGTLAARRRRRWSMRCLRRYLRERDG
jgi:hypothetical protein